MERLFKILNEAGVDLCAPISLKNCKIIRPDKLERVGFSSIDMLNAVIIAVPYLTHQSKRNLSAYAVPRDYHGFFDEFFSNALPRLREIFPKNHFAGFADNSPIDERLAAATAGLGIIGDNGMLITEKYSSYVFLGEIVTDLALPSEPHEIQKCSGCGKCRSACPMGEIGQCLSALTQKKGALCEDEANAILKYSSVWGCDICQEVCPHTLRAIKNQTIYTHIDYFKENCISQLTTYVLDSMSDEEFKKRAYSWRKRETIRRNLTLFEKNGQNKD